jgi:hypothetical protein
MKHYAVTSGFAALLLMAGCATTSSPPATATRSVPISLQVPASEVLLLQGRAVGVQIYECRASKDDPSKFDWVFMAPEAQLYDRSGKLIIKHFAGPTWAATTDGSSVVGEIAANDNGPDAMAIPWLLLRVKSSSGHGLLSRVQFIQRINTLGGKAPAGGCSQLLLGSPVRMQYTADYLFYGPRS